MPEIELPQSWLVWAGFLVTVIVGLAIRDWASDLIASVKWKLTPGFEPMDTCILDGDKVTIIHIGLKETIFERQGKYGRTWQYIPSSKISGHDLRRVVGDDRMLDHKINGEDDGS
tara:strand:+ start:739 stop:1083 length:345 start_codon:yes stop_codon:yes gene_type:complete